MKTKINKNELCTCGSGKKYKNCCLHRKNNFSVRSVFGVLGLLVVLIIFTAVILAGKSYSIPGKQTLSAPPIKPSVNSNQAVLLPLTNTLLSKDEIEKYDIAKLNMIAASGLPGAENIDVEKCQATLRTWATMVDLETEKYQYKFRANPVEYNNSEAYFKMLVLVTVLERDLHVGYNPDLMSSPMYVEKSTRFFRNPDDLFIHGIVKTQRGTCSSLPVLTVAVGRLLGYPLKLVQAKAHLFVRWDDGKEEFNIESGGNGMKVHPDEFYKTWPFKLSKEELESGQFLKSFSPVEEYAAFLEMRGLCLLEHNKFAEALAVFSHVKMLMPKHYYINNFIGATIVKEDRLKEGVTQ